MKRLTAVVGLNVPDPKSKDGAELRFEPGDDIDPALLAAKTLRVLVDQGVIEEAK